MVPVAPARQADSDAANVREQVEILSQLLIAQSENLDEHRDKLNAFQHRLEGFDRALLAGLRSWRSTERDVAALSGLQLPPSRKGDVHE
jgi:hypothetical protein